MKKTIIATTTVMFLSGALAHAGYVCQSVPQGTTLTVQEQKSPNRVGTDTEILLQEGSKKTYYFGNLHSEGGSMLGKEVIYIYPHYNNNTLTVVSKPKSCGRGFCDPENDKIIKAVLKIANSEIAFYCNETKN